MANSWTVLEIQGRLTTLRMTEAFIGAGNGREATLKIFQTPLNQSNLPVYWVKIAESENMPKIVVKTF